MGLRLYNCCVGRWPFFDFISFNQSLDKSCILYNGYLLFLRFPRVQDPFSTYPIYLIPVPCVHGHLPPPPVAASSTMIFPNSASLSARRSDPIAARHSIKSGIALFVPSSTVSVALSAHFLPCVVKQAPLKQNLHHNSPCAFEPQQRGVNLDDWTTRLTRGMSHNYALAAGCASTQIPGPRMNC